METHTHTHTYTFTCTIMDSKDQLEPINHHRHCSFHFEVLHDHLPPPPPKSSLRKTRPSPPLPPRPFSVRQALFKGHNPTITSLPFSLLHSYPSLILLHLLPSSTISTLPPLFIYIVPFLLLCYSCFAFLIFFLLLFLFNTYSCSYSCFERVTFRSQHSRFLRSSSFPLLSFLLSSSSSSSAALSFKCYVGWFFLSISFFSSSCNSFFSPLQSYFLVLH